MNLSPLVVEDARVVRLFPRLPVLRVGLAAGVASYRGQALPHLGSLGPLVETAEDELDVELFVWEPDRWMNQTDAVAVVGEAGAVRAGGDEAAVGEIDGMMVAVRILLQRDVRNAAAEEAPEMQRLHGS